MNNSNFEQLETLTPVITRSGEGQFADLGDHRGNIILSASQTNDTYTLIDIEADFHAGPPLHIHHREDETFIIKRGRFQILVGDDIFEVGPGDTVFAPRYVKHTWRCISPDGGNALLLVTPGANFEHFALEMGRHDIFPISPETIPMLIQICEEHGLDILPPNNS